MGAGKLERVRMIGGTDERGTGGVAKDDESGKERLTGTARQGLTGRHVGWTTGTTWGVRIILCDLDCAVPGSCPPRPSGSSPIIHA